MFLNLDKSTFKRIGFRLSLGFLILFLMSSFAIFGLLYFLLKTSLEAKDREILGFRVKQYASVYEMNGLSGVSRVLSSARSQLEGENLLVRIATPEGKTLFSYEPKILEKFDRKEVEMALEKSRSTSKLLQVRSNGAFQMLEVLSEKLKDGNYIAVAKDSDDREDVLELYRQAFLLSIIPAVLIGIGASLIFAKRTLRPARDLILTMKAVQAGNVGARVKRTGSGDELDSLSEIFNQMVARIETLIRGMRESLDFVAHDLRTPMTRIRGLAERALQREDAAETSDALYETIESSDQILSLLDTIMDISEMESGTLRLSREATDVRQLFEQCADLYSIVAEEQGISLSIDAPEISFLADRRLRQVVANLLDNALKYSPRGTSVRLSAFIENDRERRSLILRVQDQGSGISDEDLPRIWDRLYRSDRSRTTRGMGLGLSLVRSIVKAHGGSVRVQSELGRGSTFDVILPMQI